MKELQVSEHWAGDVQRAGAILYDAGAIAVWLFGSRSGVRAADRLSDFDLAVEGLPSGRGIISQASRELCGKVDIVRLESATPDLRWAIAQSRIFVPRVAYSEVNSSSRSPPPDSLAGMRTSAVAELIREVAPRSVIDFGCGFGWLLAELAPDEHLERLTGVDFDHNCLAGARLRLTRAFGPRRITKVNLRQALVTYRDPRYVGHDAAAAIELIEHLEPPQLEAFANVLFGFVRPARAVLTTPNAEYNIIWVIRHPRGHRHPDHRFEWSRSEFTDWVKSVGSAHGYAVRVQAVGTVHPVWGAPTQLAVFDREYR